MAVCLSEKTIHFGMIKISITYFVYGQTQIYFYSVIKPLVGKQPLEFLAVSKGKRLNRNAKLIANNSALYFFHMASNR